MLIPTFQPILLGLAALSPLIVHAATIDPGVLFDKRQDTCYYDYGTDPAGLEYLGVWELGTTPGGAYAAFPRFPHDILGLTVRGLTVKSLDKSVATWKTTFRGLAKMPRHKGYYIKLLTPLAEGARSIPLTVHGDRECVENYVVPSNVVFLRFGVWRQPLW